MKINASIFLLIAMLITFTACSQNLTNKNDIISLFEKNQELFLKAADNEDYTAIERLSGVLNIYVSETHIDIQCGGWGFGSSTDYYGIFYSKNDNLCAIDVAGPVDKLVEHADGYLYQQEDGDNSYYVQSLGNHFYYYEAHF